MRKTVLCAVVALMSLSFAPSAQASVKGHYSALWHACNKRTDCSPGRNIRKYGVRTEHGSRPATKADLVKSTGTLDAMLHPTVFTTPVGSSVPTATAAAAVPTGGGSANGSVNPACESGGNPQVVDPTGTYWGKYQFDRQTYERFGGTNYGSASEAEQDAVAARVTYDAWPNC